MRKSLICFFVLILAPVLASAQGDSMKTSGSDLRQISSQAFDGFDECDICRELSEVGDRLIAQGKPLRKKEGAWVYAIKSQIMGLPAKAIELGVCDASGERACGWGSYVGVVIARPLKETKDYLKKKKGIDFTKEMRDEESGPTLRPILGPGYTANESILFCDSGSL
jgi:hypothetical protein